MTFLPSVTGYGPNAGHQGDRGGLEGLRLRGRLASIDHVDQRSRVEILSTLTERSQERARAAAPRGSREWRRDCFVSRVPPRSAVTLPSLTACSIALCTNALRQSGEVLEIRTALRCTDRIRDPVAGNVGRRTVHGLNMLGKRPSGLRFGLRRYQGFPRARLPRSERMSMIGSIRPRLECPGPRTKRAPSGSRANATSTSG